jgi:hypothetical protein
MKESKLGLLNDQRIPTAWKAVLDHYLQQDRGNLQDFRIPQDRNPAPRMTLDNIATSVDATIGQLKETEPEMEDVTRQLLTGLASQKSVTFICVEGNGTFVNTVRCQLPNGQLVALKLAKASHP